MIVDETIIHSPDLDSHLAYAPHLSPIICQIGGKNAEYCAKATSIVESYGYDEVNLNIDCPSSRVSEKRGFGAILMKECENAYSVVSAMNSSVQHIPISVKTRVGIELEDGEILDTLEHLIGFIDNLRERGCKKFVIHARKCVIGGLTPAQNRLVPPLNYPRVYQLCRHFPDCEFVANGGIAGLASAKLLCDGLDLPQGDVHDDAIETNTVDGCSSKHCVPCKICNTSNGSCTAAPLVSPPNLTGAMIGRACMENPAMFWDIDRYFYGEKSNPCENRRQMMEKYCQYLEETYPRRCCDVDERNTIRLPAPKVKMFTEGGCEICKEYYGSAPTDEVGIEQEPNNGSTKISSRVIDRSLKPILGVFFGLRQNKRFRRECDRLSRDKDIRNCGPGFILRTALSAIPGEMLDMAFTKTEDLDDSEIPVHHGPTINNHRPCKPL